MFRGLVATACAAAALAPPPVDAATRVVRVACDGRAVSAIPGIRGGDRIEFELVECVTSETSTLLFRFQENADDYFVDTAPTACPTPASAAKIGVTYACPLDNPPPARRLTLDPPRGSHFVSYRIVVDDAVRKRGWLVMGDRRKLVTYALRSRPKAAQPYRLERLGEYPVITDEDLLYAVIVDARQDEIHLDLSFEVEKGEVANPAPIRPSFEPTQIEAKPPPPDQEREPPYADLLLPFGQRFRGGDIVKVTIAAEMKVLTKDSTTVTDDAATKKDATTTTEKVTERQIVKLLDDVPYPQVHTRYAYNFAFGLVTSWLRQPTYAKVQTESGAEAADNRYRTETLAGGMGVKPVAALSFYLRRVDIQVPLTWKRRAVPAPTLGFSLTSPTQDLFLGFSHELVWNAQLFYGWHWGKIDELGPQGPLEDRSSSVTTVKRSDSAFFLGVTLNIGGIKDMITN